MIWSYKFKASELFYKPDVLTPVMILESEISEKGFSSCTIFKTRQEALLHIKKYIADTSPSEIFKDLLWCTKEEFNDKEWKWLIFLVFKYFMWVLIHTTVPVMKFQVNRWLKKTQKENPEWWV